MIVLASASPRRRELLAGMGFDFKIITSDAEEISKETDPGRIVEDLSAKKAAAVLEKITAEGGLPEDRGEPLLIIAADTLVFFKDEILGKPVDKADGVEILQALPEPRDRAAVAHGDGDIVRRRPAKLLHNLEADSLLALGEEGGAIVLVVSHVPVFLLLVF